jgi:hypothetical protein
MNTKLGKITNVRFGFIPDYPFLFGINFDFFLGDGSGIGSGGKYTVNISKDCKWSSEERKEAIEDLTDFVVKILKDAKVDNVYDLKNKPVEVCIQDNTFVNFRILTEVL